MFQNQSEKNIAKTAEYFTHPNLYSLKNEKKNFFNKCKTLGANHLILTLLKYILILKREFLKAVHGNNFLHEFQIDL